MPQLIGYIAGNAAVSWATAAGFSAVEIAVIGGVASYAASEITANILGPDDSDLAASGALANKASNNAPVPVIIGSRTVGGTRVYLEINGDDNEYLHQVIVLSEGEIDAINDVYLNGVLSSDSRFSGLVDVVKKTGSDAQAAVSSTDISNVPSSWTSSHKLSGFAYIYVRIKWDADAFPQGLPVITCDVDGKKTYDPRTSTTTFNHNPALAIRDYLINSRYGRSIPTSQIDDTAIIAAANYCDATVTKGGATSARYTCDGLINTAETSLSILQNLLSSCRGFLVFSAGQYKLVLDKTETAVFTFSEDNIIGQWSIALGNKKTTYNRITAKFFNPERSWQLDQAVIDSSSLRTDDNGLVLERQTMLPFTSNIYTAQQIATINLNQSRQGVTCQFTATIEALRVEVGDVVYVKHDTPGWDTLNSNQGKLFRVIAMSLQANDEVAVTCREYDSTVYDFGTIATVDATPNTALPDPSTVVAPTNLVAVSSGNALLNEDGTVTPVVKLSWTASADAFVSDYLINVRINGQTETLAEYRTATTELSISAGLVVGTTYKFYVRAINSMGAKSGLVYAASHTVSGKTTNPAAVTSLTATAKPYSIILDWTNPTDNDFSHVEIRRHSTSTFGSATQIATIKGDTYVDSVGSLTTFYYWVRAVDTTGNASSWSSSVTATSTAVTADDVSDAGAVMTNDTDSQTMIGGLLVPNAIVDKSSDGIMYTPLPTGGLYSITSSHTGFIKIALPTELDSNYVNFTIEIGNAPYCGAFTIHVSGKTGSTSGNSWSGSPSAIILRKRSTGAFTPSVRFGHDGAIDKNCIWLGETTTSWGTPNITIRDVTAEYTTDANEYSNGWEISAQTSLGSANIDTYTTGDLPDASGAVYADKAGELDCDIGVKAIFQNNNYDNDLFIFGDGTDNQIGPRNSSSNNDLYIKTGDSIKLESADGTSLAIFSKNDGVTIAGDLTVSGTTTTVNTETINLADNIILLNSNEAGTPSQNGGIEVERGTSTNVDLRFNESNDRWEFTNDGSTYYNIPTSSELGTVSGDLSVSGVVSQSGAFYENNQSVTDDYTVTSGRNAMSAGPITVNNGVTVTVQGTSAWTIVQR